jgi:hypothetical protein
MSKDVILGLIRHVLTAAGGLLVAKGRLDVTDMDTIAGAVVTIIGGIWSVYDKRQKSKAGPPSNAK